MRRKHMAVIMMLAATIAAAIPLEAVAYPRPGDTEAVSGGAGGVPANADSRNPSINVDGRTVAFVSSASNLVAGDTNERADAFVRDRDAAAIERVSLNTDGAEAVGGTLSVSVSADGRHVAFDSIAGNLVPGDNNGTWDVFVRDRERAVTERVSVGPAGAQADGASHHPAISADGRYIAFHSEATDLTADDTNATTDVFVHDRATGVTERVSVGLDGGNGDGYAFRPAVSGDGRFVTFWSSSSNLVAGDTNGMSDVFVRDRAAGTTERVSLAGDGTETNGHSYDTSISVDGRYVAFQSWASNLVPGDTNEGPDIFLHDRVDGTTERVSVGTDGGEAGNHSFAPSVSADGRFVSFTSLASDLVPDDTNQAPDVFVRDRHAGTTERVSVRADGSQVDGNAAAPSLSADGRTVAFSSDVSGTWDILAHDRGRPDGVSGLTVVPGDGVLSVSGWARFPGAAVATAEDPAGDAAAGTADAGADLVGSSITFRPEEEDLLLTLRLGSLPGWAVQQCVRTPTFPPIATCQEASTGAGAPGILHGWRFASGGRLFEVRAVRGGSTTTTSAGEQEFSLYECSLACTRIARLSGGIGVTGADVRVALPTAELAIAGEVRLTDVVAFAALGDANTGPVMPLDEMALPDVAAPDPVVELGLAPVSTPEDRVGYAVLADLVDGNFAATVDVAELAPGNHRLWVRGCLGVACGARSVAFTVPRIDTELELSLVWDGGWAIVTATLVEASGRAPIPQSEVTFFIRGQRHDTAVTDAAGRATIKLHRRAFRGHDELRAAFTGDDRYTPSEAVWPGRK